MFLYESLSGLLGLLALVWIGFHLRRRLRPGDLLLIFFIWYGAVRFVLETFREDNWTFFGVPTAQVVSIGFIVPALLILLWRHRPGHPDDDPATHPEVATWGAASAEPAEPVEPAEPDACPAEARRDRRARDDGRRAPRSIRHRTRRPT